MSAITIDGELVHYEVLGRGRPVILLHGWVGSWRYWVPTMQNLQSKFRVYALDFYGFGDTSKNPGKYSLDHQVALLDEFLNSMVIPKAAMIGHGLGALVAVEYARRHADKVPRVMLVGAPLFETPGLERRAHPGRAAASLPSDAPRVAAVPPNPSSMAGSSSAMRAALLERVRAAAAAAGSELPLTFPSAAPTGKLPEPTASPPLTPIPSASTAPLASLTERHNPLDSLIGTVALETLLQKCFRRSDPIYEKLAVDLPKTDVRALKELSARFDSGQLLDHIWLLNMPVVILHGKDDPLVDVPGETVWDYLTHEREDTLLPIPLEGVRHFPMLEYERFNRLVTDFLETADISTLETKERWKRRSR